jgi:hypothetical protein
MALVRTSYSIDAVHTVGVPLLANSPAVYYPITTAAPVTVFGPYTGSDFIANPFNYTPKYPLRLQLYFSSVVMTGTVAYPAPEYTVTVTGPFDDYVVHRFDEKNFGSTHFISDWQYKNILVTVSVRAFLPLTDVSLQCFAGVATENVQDRSEEF